MFVETALGVVPLCGIVLACTRLESEVLIDGEFDIEATEVWKEAVVPASLVDRTVEVARIGFDELDTSGNDTTVEEELCTSLFSAIEDVLDVAPTEGVAATVEF